MILVNIKIIDLHFQTMLSFPSNNDNDTFLDSDSFSEGFFNESDLDVDKAIIGKQKPIITDFAALIDKLESAVLTHILLSLQNVPHLLLTTKNTSA